MNKVLVLGGSGLIANLTMRTMYQIQELIMEDIK